MKYVGQPIKRVEDARFLTGRGRYVDDIKLPGMLHAKVVRSPYAHAKIRSIDVSRALALRGVVGAITGRDKLCRPWNDYASPAGELIYPMAVDKVMFVGHEVAAVVAVDPSTAEDALELVDVDYEPLPCVVDPEEAAKPESVKIHDEMDKINGNVHYSFAIRAGDVQKALGKSDYVIKRRFTTGRNYVAPLETPSCIAEYDRLNDRLTLWAGAKMPFTARATLAEALGLPENKIHILIPDIGGGFGTRGGAYPHYIIASLLAMKTGRPVRITLDRREDMLVTGTRCGSVHYLEVGVNKGGKIGAWKEKVIWDSGARHGLSSANLTKAAVQVPGPYKIDNVLIEGICVYTNTATTGANRGFGSPQMNFARERMIDVLAERIGMDPLEFRLKNVIQPEEIPYRSSTGPVYDSTNFTMCLKKAAEAVAWSDDERAIDGSKRRGLGVALMQKNCGGYLVRRFADYESAVVRIEPDASVRILTSSIPQGQGHETIFAQIAADKLGISMDRIEVIHGDTDYCPYGLGTWGSRTTVTTVGALYRACDEIVDKMLTVAAHLLRKTKDEVEYGEGIFRVRGGSTSSITLKELLGVIYSNSSLLPSGMEPTLQVIATYDPPGKTLFDADMNAQIASTYDVGAHAVVVEIDTDTGKVTILRYAAAHDTGVVINPLIVDGQIEGGVMHGVGMALYESLLWDDNGQPLNPTFADYLATTSMESPKELKILHVPSPALNIPGGHRGVGESGMIAAPPAIANAIANALGKEFNDIPVTPEMITESLKTRMSA